MRGSIDSDAAGENSAGDIRSTRSESSTLAPDWLERLMGREFVPSEGITRLPRARGATAGVARWIAVAARSRAHNERSAEREACWWVASHLAEADRDLEVALAHARRALELGGDDAWRMQVSTWLERIGQHKEAAAVLVPSVSQAGTAREVARLLLRMARMQIRADEHQLARNNLLEAATVWPAHADALDLAGEVSAAKGTAESASMLLEAGDRHEQNGNPARAFEARRRAFEAAPSNTHACNALAEALDRAGRTEAADEIRRTHANASDDSQAHAIHAFRLSRAIEAGETARALSAVVDGGFESDTTSAIGGGVDEALSRAGLHDAVVARRELGTSRSQGAERARGLVDLAGLYLGRLASPDRAIEAWIEALATDPSCGEARAALRTHAHTMHDQTALAEGLIRAIRSNPGSHGAIECLRELATLAEERLSEPSLANWAYSQLGALGASDETLEKAKSRLSPRVRLQDSALASAREAVDQGDQEARLEGWRRMAAILRGRPDELEVYLDVLANLVRSGQAERRWWVDFERAAVRADRLDLLEEVARERLQQGVGRADALHYRTTLLTLAWRRGDAAAALRDAVALAEALPGTRMAHAHAWIAATVVGDDEARAQALESLSTNLASTVHATLLALAGELRSKLGQEDEATRLAEEARRTDGSAPRALLFLTTHGLRSQDANFARSLEKVASIFVPDSQHHADLVDLFEQSEDRDLAHAWVRRWLELRPWDPEIAGRLIDSGAQASNTDTLVAAIMRTTMCPLSFEVIEPMLCGGLEKLAERDVARAAKVARDLGDLYGVRRAAFRKTLIELAQATRDARFEARVLERWLACREAPNDPETWLRLSDLYRQMEEVEAAARTLALATRADAAPADVLARVEAFGEPPSGDAALSLLEAEARARSAAGDREKASEAWLALGSGRWERADDRIGAIEAWLAGLGGDEATRFARLSESLSAFANGELAAAAIRDFGLACDEPSRRASALVVAAARALALAQHRSALDLAMQAMREDPRRTDALVIIERSSERSGMAEAIDEAHSLAASGAKGRFGRRAAHFRAARTLEQRNHPELAIVHAMAAFEADPVQGSSLVMMLRLADQVDSTEVVETLVRVAEKSSRAEERAYWWIQAARVASGHSEHGRRALDLSLRALLCDPSREAIDVMGDVMRRLVASEPDDASIFELRLLRAHKALAPKLEGPVGARIALAAAAIGADVLGSATMAMVWTTAALACSGDIDEYDRMVPHAALLAGESEACAAFIDEVLSRSQGLRGTTGPSLFAFARALARSSGDTARDAKLADAEAGTTSDQAPAEVDPFADLAEELSADSEQPPAQERQDAEELSAPEPVASKYKETLPPGAWPDPEAQPAPPSPTTEPGLGSTQQEEPVDAISQAERLEQQNQIVDAIDLLEAFEPTAEQRPRVDVVLRRLYEVSGRNSKLALVLERIADRTEDQAEKLGLLVEIAGLREARSDQEGARATWQLVTEIDPTYRDAWVFLERHAGDRGEFGMLAQILLRRSMVSSSVEEARELRFRRAQVLDHELGLPDQARSELDDLTAEHGAHPRVLGYRAELAERTGGALAAAPFWARAAAVVANRNEAVALACQAASAYLDANLVEDAQHALSLTGEPHPPKVLSLLVETERRLGRSSRLGDYLDAWAETGDNTADTRARWLLEAAELAKDVDNAEAAVDRARRAAKLVPDDAAVQLRSVFLTYRIEGLAKREHVVEMLDRLNASVDRTEPDNLDLHAFLSAECLEVLRGPEQAIEHLHDRKRIVGIGPLIALALADRLATMGDPQASLALFDVALRAEDLHGVRTRAQVAFAAARAALRAGGSQLAAPYVAMVEQEPGAGQMLQRLRSEMADIVPATDEVRRQLDRLARTSKGIERAKALLQLARLSAARGTRSSNAEAEGYYVEAIAAASSDPALRDSLEEERSAFRGRLTPSKLPPPVGSAKVPTMPPPPKPPSFGPVPSSTAASPPQMPLSPLQSAPPPRWSRSSAPPARPNAHEPSLSSTISSQPPPPEPLPSSPPSTRASSAPPPVHSSAPPPTVHSSAPPPTVQSSAPPPDQEIERKLFGALASGDLDAGDQLASMLSGLVSRTQDVVAIRRRQVVLQPFSVRHLELLRDAARADRNPAQAAAVHHVVCVLTGMPAPPPPPLQAQTFDPERLITMFGRGVHGAAAEVFGEIWKYASHLFVREPSAYGLTGLERVAISAPSPVGRAYGLAARTLGLGRTPVFQRRSHGSLNLAVAALSPMSVVVTGDVEDTPELLYRMAGLLVATTPANAMLFGLPANAVKQLMKALLAAFGPPDASRARASESAVLAGELWRALPGSVQRRFGELYRDAEPFTYEDAWARALQSTRRAGLFVVGNVSVALDDAMNDPSIGDSIDVGAPDAYRSLCRVSTSAADLIRFATSTEYAEVRWREARRQSSSGFGNAAT
jgi:tetratricopeptide (TPR) repeat protein